MMRFMIERTVNPAIPVTPMVRSFLPSTTMTANPAVALREPWMIAAATTDPPST